MFVSGLLSFLSNGPSSTFKNTFFTEVILWWHMLLGFLAKLCLIMEVAPAESFLGLCCVPQREVLGTSRAHSR